MKGEKIVSYEVIKALRFIIAPFAILILGKVLFELLAFRFPELNKALIEQLHQNSSVINFHETKARLQWLTSVLLYFFVTVIFLTYIFSLFRNCLVKKTFWVFIFIIFLYSIIEIFSLNLVESTNSPIVSIFRFTFDSLKASGHYTEYQLTLIDITLMLINFIAIIIVPFGIMAGCCIMIPKKNSSSLGLNDLIRQSKMIKNLLVGGSAVMVIGIAHMQLWLNWPLSFLTDKTLHLQIQAITFAVSQYWGVVYTLTMAALYFPAAFYLTTSAKIIILEGADEQAKLNPEKWLAENHMLTSPFSQIPQLIATIAPMLIGSFGTSLGKLMPF